LDQVRQTASSQPHGSALRTAVFFSLVLLLHLKPELRPKFAAIFVGSPGEHLAGLYKFYTNDAIAMQIMQDSFLSLV
jgi:hypothetical protein